MANSGSGESVIDRVVRVLDTFTADRTVQTVSEVGRRAQLPSSTAHRVVADLVSSGLLERDDEHRVRLGMRLWELALRGSTALRLRQAALPHMEAVQAQLREHTQLVVLEEQEALCIERLSHPSAVSNITKIAGRLPLHASSAGLVLLAHSSNEFRQAVLGGDLPRFTAQTVTDGELLRRVLAQIRRTGAVVSAGAIEEVSAGVAVPIRDSGRVIAALAVVVPRHGDHERALLLLRGAAAATEAELRATRAV